MIDFTEWHSTSLTRVLAALEEQQKRTTRPDPGLLETLAAVRAELGRRGVPVVSETARSVERPA